VTSPEEVVEIFKRNSSWQARTSAEQEGFLRHMHEEQVTPEDVGKIAVNAGDKTAVMTDLGPNADQNADYTDYVDEARKYFSGPIMLAKDLMKF